MNEKRRALIRMVSKLALPVLLTNLLQSLVGVIDIYMVGRLGPTELSAIGIASTIRVLILVMLLAVSGGAMSLIAQAKGAGDPKRLSFVARQSLSSGFLLSFVLIGVGFLIGDPLLNFADSSGNAETLALSSEYLTIIFLGMPFLVMNIVINRMMQGAGDTWTPLVITTVINILNVVFNYVFMFGFAGIPAMGLTGAAVGTAASRALGVIASLTIIYSGKNVIKLLPGTYMPDLQMFRNIFSIGLPSGIQGLFRNGSRLLVISILTATEVGTYGAAAIGIGLQVESLAFMPVLGINVAGTSLVGRSLGRWQVDEARERGNLTIIMGLALMIILITPLVIFAPQILLIFDPSAHPIVQSAGVAYMRINTIFLPFTAVAMVANGNLRGAGDTLPGMLSTMINRALLSMSAAWLLAIYFEMGSMGVWYGLVIGMILEGISMLIRWRGSAWPGVALRKSAVYQQHLEPLPAPVQTRFLDTVRTRLMAMPETTEEVLDKHIIYHTPDGDMTVVFNNNDFELSPVGT